MWGPQGAITSCETGIRVPCRSARRTVPMGLSVGSGSILVLRMKTLVLAHAVGTVFREWGRTRGREGRED